MEKVNVDWNLKGKDFISQDAVRDSFIQMLMKIHGKSEPDAASVYERETTYFKKAMSESPKLAGCTVISLYSVLVDIATMGLSIQPGNKAEAYLEARGQKSGKKDEKGNDIYVDIARMVVTAYGELNLRIMAGQIIRMMNPIVLYEGDHFQPKTNDRGRLIVDYLPQIPRQKDAKIFGAYVCIELPGGSLDFKWLLDDDIERLKRYSTPRATQYNKNPEANALYSANGGQIDPGFLEAKTIKHAMRAYTKLKVSDSVSFEGDEDPENVIPESFAPKEEKKEGVTFDMGSDDQPF